MKKGSLIVCDLKISLKKITKKNILGASSCCICFCSPSTMKTANKRKTSDGTHFEYSICENCKKINVCDHNEDKSKTDSSKFESVCKVCEHITSYAQCFRCQRRFMAPWSENSV